MRKQGNLLQEDQFLLERNINIQKSSFLSNHYANKSLGSRIADDPRDPFGQRLSVFWERGDNIASVAFKKMKYNIRKLLDPDTYTHKTIKAKAEEIKKYKTKAIGMTILFTFPLFFLVPVIRPRYLKAKRDFLFQYYIQSQTIAKRLNLGNRKLTVQETEEIIKRAEERINL